MDDAFIQYVAKSIAPIRNKFYRGSKGDDKNYADQCIAEAAIKAIEDYHHKHCEHVFDTSMNESTRRCCKCGEHPTKK